MQSLSQAIDAGNRNQAYRTARVMGKSITYYPIPYLTSLLRLIFSSRPSRPSTKHATASAPAPRGSKLIQPLVYHHPDPWTYDFLVLLFAARPTKAQAHAMWHRICTQHNNAHSRAHSAGADASAPATLSAKTINLFLAYHLAHNDLHSASDVVNTLISLTGPNVAHPITPDADTFAHIARMYARGDETRADAISVVRGILDQGSAPKPRAVAELYVDLARAGLVDECVAVWSTWRKELVGNKAWVARIVGEVSVSGKLKAEHEPMVLDLVAVVVNEASLPPAKIARNYSSWTRALADHHSPLLPPLLHHLTTSTSPATQRASWLFIETWLTSLPPRTPDTRYANDPQSIARSLAISLLHVSHALPHMSPLEHVPPHVIAHLVTKLARSANQSSLAVLLAKSVVKSPDARAWQTPMLNAVIAAMNSAGAHVDVATQVWPAAAAKVGGNVREAVAEGRMDVQTVNLVLEAVLRSVAGAPVSAGRVLDAMMQQLVLDPAAQDEKEQRPVTNEVTWALLAQCCMASDSAPDSPGMWAVVERACRAGQGSPPLVQLALLGMQTREDVTRVARLMATSRVQPDHRNVGEYVARARQVAGVDVVRDEEVGKELGTRLLVRVVRAERRGMGRVGGTAATGYEGRGGRLPVV